MLLVLCGENIFNQPGNVSVNIFIMLFAKEIRWDDIGCVDWTGVTRANTEALYCLP